MKFRVLRLVFISVLLISASIAIETETDLSKPIPVTNKKVANVINLGADVNSVYTEYTPFITHNGQFLYFESNRPGGMGPKEDFDLWYSRRLKQTIEGDKFTRPINLKQPINSINFDGLPSLRERANGTYEIYFTSLASRERKGKKETNIYYSAMNHDGTWQRPKPVFELNTDFHDRMPSISADGRNLYFSSNRSGGYGKDDIWVSEYDYANRHWKEPKNLGPNINTTAAEIAPSIHVDTITLYFSSDRAKGIGGYDIYFSQKNSLNTFANAKNLGKPYNSVLDDEYPTVPSSGKYMYFASNRDGGFGDFDIYRANVPRFAKPEVIIALRGTVQEQSNGRGIEANIKIESPDKENRNLATSQPEGRYLIDLRNKSLHRLIITAPGFEPHTELIDLRDVNESKTIIKNFKLTRVFELPSKYNILVNFVDENNNVLKPKASYLIEPNSKQRISFTYNSYKKAYYISMNGRSTFKDKTELKNFLASNTLKIEASLTGFNQIKEIYALDEVISYNPVKYQADFFLDPIKMKKKSIVITKVEEKPKENNTKEKRPVVADGRHILLATIQFSTNVSNRIENAEKTKLKKVVSYLRQNKDAGQVLVQGHTDHRGNWSFNVRLSKSRALYIKSQLAKMGVSSKAIIPEWFSFGKPLEAAKTIEAYRKNRRVEIFFRKK